jgi:hypothetical protein
MEKVQEHNPRNQANPKAETEKEIVNKNKDIQQNLS